MPTYQYRCKECGHELEARQSFSEDSLTDCPACKTSALTKVFSAIGISFKGDGFYKNDHGANAKSRKPDEKSSSSSDSSSAADKSSGSSDTSTGSSDKSSGSSDTKSSSSSSSEKSTASSSSGASSD